MKLQYQPEGASYWSDYTGDADAMIEQISRETRYGTPDEIRALLNSCRPVGTIDRWFRDADAHARRIEANRAETASDMRKCGVCRKMVHSSQMMIGGVCADCD